MDIVVTADPDTPARGRLRFHDVEYACTLGRSGIATEKQEGDGATPAGRFPLRGLYYRPDRLDKPVTGLPVTALTQTDGWCDAPGDANYNRFVTHPYAASAERLWRDDGLYDLIVVLGHNDDPVRPGAGSAIFLHVMADDGTPTEGCVALQRDDLLAVLRACSRDTWIEIRDLKS